MYKLICVTNRGLVRGDFLQQIRRIAAAGPDGILLRAKDLTPEDYARLASEVEGICAQEGVACMLHSHPVHGAAALHLPLPVLRVKSAQVRGRFEKLGASCHSTDEAREAVSLGADYLIAGHIYATDCKKGLPGRGLAFLREVCGCVDVPVYAIGGITAENAGDVVAAGAAGVCIMSGLMQSEDPGSEIWRIRRAMEHGH